MITRRTGFLLLSIVLSCLLAQACAYADNCIGQVKTQDLGSPVTLTDRVVTGVFPADFSTSRTRRPAIHPAG